MIRRSLTLLAPIATALVLSLAVGFGCGDSSAPVAPAGDSSHTEASQVSADANGFDATVARDGASNVDEGSLLNAIMHLLKTAATNPGGDNFNIAKDHLNEIFAALGRSSSPCPPTPGSISSSAMVRPPRRQLPTWRTVSLPSTTPGTLRTACF